MACQSPLEVASIVRTFSREPCTLLLMRPDLLVQQVDQAPRDPIDGLKSRKHVPEEVSRPGDPSLIPRPRRGAEFGEVRPHAVYQPYSGLTVGGDHGHLPGKVTFGTGDGRTQQLSQLVQGILTHSVGYLAKVEPPLRGVVHRRGVRLALGHCFVRSDSPHGADHHADRNLSGPATRVVTPPNSRCPPISPVDSAASAPLDAPADAQTAPRERRRCVR